MTPRSLLALAPALFGSMLCFVSPASAKLSLPPLFSDHMILQRDSTAVLWGTADPNTEIALQYRRHRFQALADMSGRWEISFLSGAAGGPLELIISGDGEVVLRDVLVGDVWFCSGQSNMEMQVKEAANAAMEIAEANDGSIRQFFVERRAVDIPEIQVRGKWTVASPSTVGAFSATAYYFAQEYRKAHPEVPVGIVNSTWGGSPIQAWCSRQLLGSDREFTLALERWDKSTISYAELMPKYRAELAAWPAEVERAKEAGKMPPLKPQPPMGGPGSIQYKPAGLFNGMVHPYFRLSLRGVLWYQGESNREEADLYRRLFPAMIREWRRGWGRAELPFIFVQLPNIGRIDLGGSRWPWLREAQTAALRLPNTAMAVTIDIGETTNEIHPANKQDVGRRLAWLARKHVDGDKIVADSPRYQSAQFNRDRVRVRFELFGSGLLTRGGGPPQGFVIAGADQVFHPAEAVLVGENVELAHSAIKEPKAVRYAWSNQAEGNMTNLQGLPLEPFRTDDWPRLESDAAILK